MESTRAQKQTDSVLGLKEKVAFFSVNFGNIPIMTMLNTYLLLFYTDVVGLDPVAIGTLFLIARIIDGVSDPIMGYVIDHLPRLKLGRFRGYLLSGVILCCLNFLLVWFGPGLFPAAKLVVVYISYLLIGWTFDLMDIPLNSMIAVMSDHEKDRNTLSIIKGTAYMIGTVVIVGGALPLIGLFPTKGEGFTVVIAAVTATVLFLSVIGTLGIKERIFPVEAKKYSPRNLIEIVTARPVLVLFLQTLVTQIGVGVSSGITVFFFLYALKRPDLFPIGASGYILGIILASIISQRLISRFGKKTCQTAVMAVSLAGSILLFLTPTSMPYAFILVTLLTSPATGMSMILSYGIQADNMDYVEWKLGYRAEAAVASLNSFIVKAAGGVGSAVGAYLLAYYHYVPNAETQAAETIRGFYIINFAIPGLLTLLALIIWVIGYPLTKQTFQQMMVDLAARRNSIITEQPSDGRTSQSMPITAPDGTSG